MQTTLLHLMAVPIWSAVVCQLANFWPASCLVSIPIFAGAHTALLSDLRVRTAMLGAMLALLVSFFMLPLFATLLSIVGLFQLGPGRAPTDLNSTAIHMSLIVYCAVLSVVSGYVSGRWQIARRGPLHCAHRSTDVNEE